MPESSYVRFDDTGSSVSLPIYLATESLLPLVTDAQRVSEGGTWWPTVEYPFADFELLVARACRLPATTLVMTSEQYRWFEKFDSEVKKNRAVIIVTHLEKSLLAVASSWRSQCMVPVIAITGSIGKTTTVAMLSSIFAVDRLPVLVSSHDEHSLIKLAIDMLHITEKQVAAVFEVGAMQPGDMIMCAQLLQPTIALITAICPAHLQGMEALHLIASEKQKIFSFFSPSQVGIVCGDYPVLVNHAYEHPVVRFGLKNKNVVTAKKITLLRDECGILKTKIVLRVYDYEEEIVLYGHHKGTIYAALAAASLAHFLYIPFSIVVRGLASYMPREGRFCERLLRDGRGILIQDNYSISPESVKAAFHAVHAIDSARRKIAVIGNIPDLGDKASFWHRHVGRELIKTRSISDLVLVGDATKPIYSVAPATMNIFLAPEWSDAAETLHNLLGPADNLVLVTGAVPHKINHLVAQLT